jgi:hypothetical protein
MLCNVRLEKLLLSKGWTRERPGYWFPPTTSIVAKDPSYKASLGMLLNTLKSRLGHRDCRGCETFREELGLTLNDVS